MFENNPDQDLLNSTLQVSQINQVIGISLS